MKDGTGMSIITTQDFQSKTTVDLHHYSPMLGGAMEIRLAMEKFRQGPSHGKDIPNICMTETLLVLEL